MDDKKFESLVVAGLDAIPEEHAKLIDNVAVVIADEPTPEQRVQLRLRPHTLLFGLYEGIPKTKRTSYQIALPDKITIFKNQILAYCGDDEEAITAQVVKTVEHEIAHHFGFDEPEVRALGL